MSLKLVIPAPTPPRSDAVVIGDAGIQEGWQGGDVPEPPRPKPTGTPLDPLLDEVDDFLDILDPGAPAPHDD